VASLDPGVGAKSEMLNVLARQTLSDGVDVSTGMLLFFLSADRQGDNHLYHKYELRCPHSVESRAPTGYIIVEGSAPSMLDSFTVFSKDGCSVKLDWQGGWGSFREADAVALDIAAGRKENTVMTFA